MQTRLQGIENPQSLLMRLTYWYSKRKFGKVLTPLKVAYSRLPFAFSLWANKIHPLERKLPLAEDLVLLVRVYVAQLNTCSFCVDIGRALSIRKFHNQEKFTQLEEYPASPLFSPAEKAALDFARALTVHKKVSDEVYWRADRYYSGSQLVALAWVVSTEHVYNLMNTTFHIESDGLCRPSEPSAFSAKENSSRARWLQDATKYRTLSPGPSPAANFQ
jgi:alkylhydroperoxidase family enzyme